MVPFIPSRVPPVSFSQLVSKLRIYKRAYAITLALCMNKIIATIGNYVSLFTN